MPHAPFRRCVGGWTALPSRERRYRLKLLWRLCRHGGYSRQAYSREWAAFRFRDPRLGLQEHEHVVFSQVTFAVYHLSRGLLALDIACEVVP